MAAKEPRYRQLAEELAAAIADGGHPVGSRLPTEAELCERHELSRGTVRQAMRELEDRGLIERRTSAGTIVVRAEPLSAYTPVLESSYDIAWMVRHTRVMDENVGEVAADEALAARLGSAVGSRWFRVAGLRVLRDGTGEGDSGGAASPLSWSEQYLAAELSAASREVALRGQFDAAEIKADRIEQEVRAELLPAPVAAALGEPAGSAALVVVRRYFNDGRLVTVSVNTHPGARFSVTSVLSTPGP